MMLDAIATLVLCEASPAPPVAHVAVSLVRVVTLLGAAAASAGTFKQRL